MSQSPVSSYFVGSLITSLIGGILLLATDFAGSADVNYYAGTRTNTYVYATANPFSFLVFGLVALGLFYCSYISFLGLQQPENPPSQKMLHWGFLASGMVFLISMLGGIIFIASESGADDWWLDTAFYAGALGGLLTALLLYLVIKEMFGLTFQELLKLP